MGRAKGATVVMFGLVGIAADVGIGCVYFYGRTDPCQPIRCAIMAGGWPTSRDKRSRKFCWDIKL